MSLNSNIPRIFSSRHAQQKYLKEAQTEFQQVKGQLFDGSRVSVTGDYEKSWTTVAS